VRARRVRLYTRMAARTRLHSRWFEVVAIACAFDLLGFDGEELRRSRWPVLLKLIGRERDGSHYVAHCQIRRRAFQAAGELSVEGDCLEAAYRVLQVEACKSWIKVRNPKSPAYQSWTDVQKRKGPASPWQAPDLRRIRRPPIPFSACKIANRSAILI
jgi:hypothetical protein